MFRDAIQKMVDRMDGGRAGLLMGFDGISVEVYNKPGSGADINTVGMELAHVITQLRRTAEALEVGGVSEVALTTERLTVLLRLVTDEYFLACALEPTGNLGKARYLLRITAPAIRAEL